MKILHVISSTDYHGAENMAAELIRQLSFIGFENYLGIFYDEDRSNKDILDVVKNHIKEGTVISCRSKVDVKTICSLHRYIKKNQISIIHSHKYKTNIYSFLARIGTNCRLVSTCHNWLGESFKWQLYKTLDKNILRAFDAVVGVSDEIVEELRTHVAFDKIHKIENGIDIMKFQRFDKIEAKRRFGLSDKKVVGFVGRLSHDKGVAYLFQAMRNLIDDGVDVHAIITGDGDYSGTLKDIAETLGVRDHVIFTGNRSDTPLVYSAIDVFVLPSLKEAFPLVILEAMACGVPVVATRVGDIPKIIDNNISGMLVEPRDVDALSDTLGKLLSDDKTAERLAHVAYAKAREKYSSRLMALRYKEIYERILN